MIDDLRVESAEIAAIHRREHLGVPNGIKAETLRDVLRHNLSDSIRGKLWFLNGDELQIRLTVE